MGKYAKYKRTYKTEWESLPQFRGWLTVNKDDNDMAYCKICNSSLRPHKADLLRHSKRPMHKSKLNSRNAALQPNLQQMGVTSIGRETKEADLILAIHVAVHGSIKTVDHLSEICKSLGKGSRLENLKLHRTKCSALIKNVISPALLEQLINDVGNSKFSLIIDESTDVSVCKYMAICIRYFSKSKSKIVTNYLGIIEVVRATADTLTEQLLEFLKNNKLNVKNIIGLGTDGANNMCGKNHSVYTLLQQHSPKLQLVKCVAHSLHLCCSKATEVLPSSLDFLIKETYNWFSCSPLRRSLYKETFNLINAGTHIKFHQFVQLANTRWLSRANAVRVILEQWLELKTHFGIVVDKEKCYMARTLNEMFKDDKLRLFLTFLSPLLNNINKINMLFQSESTDIFKIYTELYMLLLLHLRIIVKPIFLDNLNDITQENFEKILNILNNPLALIAIDLVDFGYLFREMSSQCNNLQKNDINSVKERCRDFVVSLLKELVIRMPSNINVINALKNLIPENVLKTFNRPLFEKLPLFLAYDDINIAEMEVEWKNLVNVKFDINNNCNSESEESWCAVFNYKDSAGNYMFPNISNFAITVLTLPLSNAIVERVFSSMNNIKTKARNKINMILLDSLLRIKVDFQINKSCCQKFEVSESMYLKFKSDMYKNTLDNDNDNETLQLSDEFVMHQLQQ